MLKCFTIFSENIEHLKINLQSRPEALQLLLHYIRILDKLLEPVLEVQITGLAQLYERLSVAW